MSTVAAAVASVQPFSESHVYCATLHTMVLVAGALYLAWSAGRWRWTVPRLVVYFARLEVLSVSAPVGLFAALMPLK